MPDRYPDYDVLARRGTLSWNRQTRATIDRRLALAELDPGLGEGRITTLRRIAARIVPQPEGRPPVNVVAMVLAKIGSSHPDGFRHAALPTILLAWTIALDAIDAHARMHHSKPFAEVYDATADDLLHAVEQGDTPSEIWEGMNSQLFWSWRLIPDLLSAYWAYPSTWSAMGFGGPASPRGYVRLGINMRDPWEAEEQEQDERQDAA